jgi:hypothetical protein
MKLDFETQLLSDSTIDLTFKPTPRQDLTRLVINKTIKPTFYLLTITAKQNTKKNIQVQQVLNNCFI